MGEVLREMKDFFFYSFSYFVKRLELLQALIRKLYLQRRI